MVALAVFAVPPLLANAYLGVREVDPEVRDAARGMGMSGRQMVRRVELPLAVPYLAAGFRTAAVQVVATATLAALVNGGGLGMIIAAASGSASRPAATRSSPVGCSSSCSCLRVEGVLALVQRLVTPRAAAAGRAAPAAGRAVDAAGLPGGESSNR